MKTLKNIFVFCVGSLALFYLLNPGAGVFELLPDNLPLIGNIDEAAAAILLIACLRYFGLDISAIFKQTPKTNSPAGHNKLPE